MHGCTSHVRVTAGTGTHRARLGEGGCKVFKRDLALAYQLLDLGLFAIAGIVFELLQALNNSLKCVCIHPAATFSRHLPALVSQGRDYVSQGGCMRKVTVDVPSGAIVDRLYGEKTRSRTTVTCSIMLYKRVRSRVVRAMRAGTGEDTD